MSEIASGLKSLFEKIGDFLHIFDLSFIVSGAVIVAAIDFTRRLSGGPMKIEITGWLSVFAVILACYVSGLVAFAIGRWIRMGIGTQQRQTRFVTHVRRILSAHRLENDEPFRSYLAEQESDIQGTWRLYVRLWAELRTKIPTSQSLSLLNRYWVLAAIYDGLAVASLAWIPAILFWSFGQIAHESWRLECWAAPMFIALLVVSFLGCLREADRFLNNQAEELIATVASVRKGI